MAVVLSSTCSRDLVCGGVNRFQEPNKRQECGREGKSDKITDCGHWWVVVIV